MGREAAFRSGVDDEDDFVREVREGVGGASFCLCISMESAYWVEVGEGVLVGKEGRWRDELSAGLKSKKDVAEDMVA